MTDSYPDRIGRNQFGKTIGPFNEQKALDRSEFVVCRGPDFCRIARAIKVEVVDAPARCLVLVEEGKRRAGCFGRVCAPAGCEAAGEMRLARAKVATQGNRRTGRKASGECPSRFFGFRGGRCGESLQG